MDNQQNKSEMKSVENLIGKVMQVGVFLAAAVMLLGVLMFLITGNSGYSGDYHPTTFASLMTGLVQFKAYAIIMLGLFLLILTPVLRVIVSIYAFYVARDKMYVWITTIVLIILVFAMIIGIYGI
ncbi:membrane protein [Paucilactobacillus hokkaidonensis JCM 18461]|uniref:Membrane protein n=2 Tax=Paucilactobacillus hokkaidonensis TaxID=1193095 RepID=A0A0A1GUL8_9LACO|nr:DUF1634 domain-containing protein [Paucilactobacillus hokkaidonensis]KRO10653.1 integral membrane protein [Paucilactobacillus hokkaidonensis]BAP85645.1 membrane protein [Paucilactobacillus hokkaidonensis JCM 18461]